MTAPLVIVGDALLDRDLEGSVERIAPDAPVPVLDENRTVSRPGGAGLAAVLTAREGRPVTLVTALADDDAGREVTELLEAAGVRVVNLGTDAATCEKVRVRASGQPLLRIDRGEREGVVGPLPPAGCDAITTARAVLVADYGRGLTGVESVRAALAEAAQRVPLVWDPHPRGRPPVPGARLVTPNRSEAEWFTRGSSPVDGAGLAAVTARARLLLRTWNAAAVAITLGSRGAVLVDGDAHPLAVPATAVTGGDACGAGDRFAATAASRLADGALPSEAVVDAVLAASAFVEAGGAGGVRLGPSDASSASAVSRGDPAGEADPAAPDPAEVIRRTRAAGGTAVATGGCFDIVHAGHVAMLQAARSLGDCLVVCLNSDASVRRLKGPGRPLVAARDRAAVLLALGCVDAVAVFEEDTPVAILERLRPDVWAKGADYAVADLPEAAVLSRWGGQAVVLPYLEGRSTTRLLQEVLRRGNG